MNKKYAFGFVIFAVLISGIAVALFAGCGGETGADAAAGAADEAAPMIAQESSGQASSQEAMAENLAPIPGAQTLDEAVEAATALPETWDYDPQDRVIFQESVAIDYPLSFEESIWSSRLTAWRTPESSCQARSKVMFGS